MRPKSTRAAVAGMAAIAAVTVPDVAMGAVVSQSGGVVTYQAAPGERNLVGPSVFNGRIRIQESDAATPLSAGLGCSIVSTRVAECAGGSQVRLNLGDRDDAYYGTGDGSIPSTVNGDAGNDIFYDGAGAARRETYNGGSGVDVVSYFLSSVAVSASLDGQANDGQAGETDLVASDVEDLQGGPGADRLTGNSAANRLRGEGGADRLTALGGNDRFEEGFQASGADLIAGGSGLDLVSYAERSAAGVTVRLDGAAGDGQSGENDNVLPDVERLAGTRFADRLSGSDLANAVSGLAGNDVINPGGGADEVSAGDGDDTINTRDGVRDVVRGNAGLDRFEADSIDSLTQ
jgi:Ca2+-binding RTX toxin-like protein